MFDISRQIWLVTIQIWSWVGSSSRIWHAHWLKINTDVLIFSLSEFIVVTIIYLFIKPNLSDETLFDLFSAPLLEEPQLSVEAIESQRLHKSAYKIHDNPIESVGIKKKLQNVYLKQFPEIYKFINETVDLKIDVKIDDQNLVLTDNFAPINFMNAIAENNTYQNW